MRRRLAWGLVVGRREPGWAARTEGIRAVAALPAPALRDRTDRALRAHLAWAASSIPWWKERVRPDAELAAFPPLSRADLQAGFDDLRDPARSAESLKVESSGGSTGQPVRVWQDADHALWSFSTEIHVLRTWGLEPWDRRAYLWGDDREQAQIGWKERVARALWPNLFLNAFGMDDARMAGFADRLDAFRPAIVQGYATALDLFASWCLRTGRRVAPPRVVRSSAETLAPEARARIESAFGVPVRDVYGSRESSHLAAQCAEGGFHVLSHGRVLEIVDDRGAPCPPGVPGRVLVTDLTNRAMGLVRYENGDVASWSADPEPCPCGCAYPRLERVHGRTTDFLTTASGARVHGEWFTHLFYGRPDVTSFQVHQRTRDLVEVRTVGTADAADVEPLLAKMRSVLGASVVVRWERVGTIPPTRSGKHRFTISEVPFLRGRS